MSSRGGVLPYVLRTDGEDCCIFQQFMGNIKELVKVDFSYAPSTLEGGLCTAQRDWRGPRVKKCKSVLAVQRSAALRVACATGLLLLRRYGRGSDQIPIDLLANEWENIFCLTLGLGRSAVARKETL